MCPDSHPQLVAPNDPHADAPLFGCTYSPSYLASLDGLRPYRDAYAAASPERAAELKAIQDRAEARGRTIWSYRLGNVIKADQAVREALWDVDNAFLEVVHAAGLLNMGAQVTRDVELGRRAALGSSGVLKGWLASYGLGLGAPEPRVLPTWNLGTTPVSATRGVTRAAPSFRHWDSVAFLNRGSNGAPEGRPGLPHARGQSSSAP